MTPDAAAAITRSAIMATLEAAGPMLAACLVIGLAVGLMQALTQVQEATLAFVPKLVGAALALVLGASFIGNALARLTRDSIAMIVAP